MRTQAQIHRFAALQRSCDWHRETILSDIVGPDGVLTVLVQVPTAGKVWYYIAADGETRVAKAV